MKLDHFADFRQAHLKNREDPGNMGTISETASEMNDFPCNVVVPHLLAGEGTKEPTMDLGTASAGDHAFPVPQAASEAGNIGLPIKTEAKQGMREPVPSVPPVPLENKEKKEQVRARDFAHDSRSPIIPPEVRAKIEAIEIEARARGWPAELLWNAGFWDCPRGLAAVLDADDEISAVAPDYIEILKTRRNVLKFLRRAG